MGWHTSVVGQQANEPFKLNLFGWYDIWVGTFSGRCDGNRALSVSWPTHLVSDVVSTSVLDELLGTLVEI